MWACVYLEPFARFAFGGGYWGSVVVSLRLRFLFIAFIYHLCTLCLFTPLRSYDIGDTMTSQ